MKRDKQYLREILEQIENGTTSFNTLTPEIAVALGLSPEDGNPDGDRLKYHLDLAEQDGLIDILFKSGGGNIVVKGITSRGHNFLDVQRS